MLDWLAKSAWRQALSVIMEAINAKKSGNELFLSITGINRLTGVPTNFLITQKDIPHDFDVVSPKLIPIIMGNSFIEMSLYSIDGDNKELILSVKRPI